MAYVNLPPNLQAMFQDLTDRLTKLEQAQRFTVPNTPPLSSQPSITGLGTGDPSYPRTGDTWLNTSSNAVRYVDTNGAVQEINPISNSASITGNYIINGNMDVWQRYPAVSAWTVSSGGGGSFTGYTADRWYCTMSAPAFGSAYVDRDTSVVAPGGSYSLWFSNSAAGGIGPQVAAQQVIETSNTLPLAGQTVTLSAYLQSSVAVSGVSLGLSYSTSVDAAVGSGFNPIAAVSTTVNTTTSMARYSVSGLVPSNAKTLRIEIICSQTLDNKTDFRIGGAQLERGSQATPFRRSGGTIAGEIQLCQRYYNIFQPTELGIANPYFGVALGTGAQYSLDQYPVPMRAIPTLTAFPSTGISQATFGATYISNTAGAAITRNIRCTTQLSALFPQLSYSSTDNSTATLTAAYSYGYSSSGWYVQADADL